jgi:uncharacterized protein YmfQ (DUF2313 family)
MSLFTTDDYRQALQALILQGGRGLVTLIRFRLLFSVSGRQLQRSDNDALGILSGAFPQTATIMLPEWERPLVCLTTAQSVRLIPS